MKFSDDRKRSAVIVSVQNRDPVPTLRSPRLEELLGISPVPVCHSTSPDARGPQRFPQAHSDPEIRRRFHFPLLSLSQMWLSFLLILMTNDNRSRHCPSLRELLVSLVHLEFCPAFC